MCRLLAQISKKPTNIIHWLFEAKIPFVDFSKKIINKGPHNSGWGIASFKNNSWKIYKEGKEEVKKYNFEKANEFNSKIILFHLRHASVGSEITKNAHPFSYSNWAFEHNGGIDLAETKKYLSPKFLKELKSDTDSEVFFLLIMQYFQKTKNILQAIKETLEIVKKFPHRGLNFILSDGKNIYAYRDANSEISKEDREKYYVLHYLKKVDKIVFSSDKLDDKNWQPISLGELVIVDKSLKLKSFMLD